MKISNERAPKVAEQKGPKTAQSGELEVLKTLQTLVKPAGPAADPVLSALQALTGVAAPAAATDPVLTALQALTGVQAPTPAAATATTAKASFDASARQASPTKPLLPNSVSPPDNDRLFRCFQDAWKSAYGNTRLATTAEREALMKLAEELRGQKKSAVEIEYTLLAHIKGGGAAGGAGGAPPVGANPTEVRSAAKEAFKSIFGREPTPQEADHWAAEGDKLAQQGMDATRVKYALMTPMQQTRDKVDPNDRNVLNNLAREAFKGVFGREPNATELKTWADKAEAMAKDNKDATTIKYALVTPMQQERDKVDPNDRNTLNNLAREAFRSIHGREPNATELKTWADKAEAMAKDNKDATTIKYALMTPMQQARDKVDPNDRNALNTLARDAFKGVFGREPDATELKTWADKAEAMARDNKDATTIKYSLITPMQEQRDGGGKTDDDALHVLIDNAFREVLGGAYRPPSENEKKEWLKIAQKLRDDGKMNATAIKHMLAAEVRTAFRNQ